MGQDNQADFQLWITPVTEDGVGTNDILIYDSDVGGRNKGSFFFDLTTIPEIGKPIQLELSYIQFFDGT